CWKPFSAAARPVSASRRGGTARAAPTPTPPRVAANRSPPPRARTECEGVMRILYLCPDLGIPVLGRKGAAVHVRSLAAALARAGHAVAVAAAVLQKSPWEPAAGLDLPVLHFPPGPEAQAAVLAVKEFTDTLGVADSLPGEFRRILLNRDLGRQLRRRVEKDPPHLLFERAPPYRTPGAGLAPALGRPLPGALQTPPAGAGRAECPAGGRAVRLPGHRAGGAGRRGGALDPGPRRRRARGFGAAARVRDRAGGGPGPGAHGPQRGGRGAVPPRPPRPRY